MDESLVHIAGKRSKMFSRFRSPLSILLQSYNNQKENNSHSYDRRDNNGGDDGSGEAAVLPFVTEYSRYSGSSSYQDGKRLRRGSNRQFCKVSINNRMG